MIVCMEKGVIVEISGDKTAKVELVRSVKHALYRKIVKRKKKVSCHFEQLELKKGDAVLVQESRPYSKTKKYVVVKKVIL